MPEEIAQVKNNSTISSQASDITNTLNPINHNLLYHPSSHIRNKGTKITDSTTKITLGLTMLNVHLFF